MKAATDLLEACKPLVAFVSLLFGVLAAWKGLGEVIPVINQIIPVSVNKGGSAQTMATVAGALALVVMALGGGKVGKQ